MRDIQMECGTMGEGNRNTYFWCIVYAKTTLRINVSEHFIRVHANILYTRVHLTDMYESIFIRYGNEGIYLTHKKQFFFLETERERKIHTHTFWLRVNACNDTGRGRSFTSVSRDTERKSIQCDALDRKPESDGPRRTKMNERLLNDEQEISRTKRA